ATMLDAFKTKEFDLEPALDSWKNPPRFLGNQKKDPPVDTWLDQVKQGCRERKIPKESWHKVGQRFLGDKARKRLDELQEVLRNLHGGNYRWDWKRFKIAMRNMGWELDDKKTESVNVKSSGSWWIIGRDKHEVSEEPVEMKPTDKKKPVPTRRATVSDSPTTEKSHGEKAAEGERPAPKRRAATWLGRSPSNASLFVPPLTSISSLSQSHTFFLLTHHRSNPRTSPPPPPPPPVTTTVAQAPIWLLNACNALDFLHTEHPKVMSTLAAVLLTVGSLPALPAISAGAGGTILASHAVQAAGAIAVGVGNWLKATQDAKAAATEAQSVGGQATIEDVTNH
ncbi:hypothetical protein BJV78DRAFT_1135398, partial [Lactifluus subvellereus]